MRKNRYGRIDKKKLAVKIDIEESVRENRQGNIDTEELIRENRQRKIDTEESVSKNRQGNIDTEESVRKSAGKHRYGRIGKKIGMEKSIRKNR